MIASAAEMGQGQRMTQTQSGIQFYPEQHLYFRDGAPLESVSKMVARLKPRFDAAFHAARMAKREDIPAAEVLRVWDAKREMACALGKSVHGAIDAYLGNRMVENVTPEYRAWLNWWSGASAHLGAQQVEWIVGSDRLKIAGTVDALMQSRKSGQSHIFDWKTNGRFETESRHGEYLLPPFDDLQNCELINYSLQVSLYRLLVQEELLEETGDAWIIHISADRVKAWRALDLRQRLCEWLNA